MYFLSKGLIYRSNLLILLILFYFCKYYSYDIYVSFSYLNYLQQSGKKWSFFETKDGKKKQKKGRKYIPHDSNRLIVLKISKNGNSRKELKDWKDCLYDRSRERTFLRTTFYDYFMISIPSFFVLWYPCLSAVHLVENLSTLLECHHLFDTFHSFIRRGTLNGPFSSFHPIVSKIVVVVRGKTISTRGTEKFLYGALWECAFFSEEITERDFKVLFLLLYNIQIIRNFKNKNLI